MADPAAGAHARREGHQPALARLLVWVHYGQMYLLEQGSDFSGMLNDALATPAGIICVRPGSALLITGSTCCRSGLGPAKSPLS